MCVFKAHMWKAVGNFTEPALSAFAWVVELSSGYQVFVREYLPASHLVDLCLYFYEVRILKVWEIYHAVLHFVFVDASFTCSATFFLSPLLAAVARTLREWTVHSIFFLLRVVVAKERFKLSTLNTLHSWDRLWTLGSVPPEGSGHVVARFPAPSRDCVRFVVRLQGVTDLKSLRSKSP